MEFGVCTSFKQAASFLGIVDFIEENVNRLLKATEDDDAFNEASLDADHSPIPIAAANCFIPGNLKCVGPDRDIDRLLAYCRTVFRRAEALKLQTIVFGSGGSRSIPDSTTEKQAIEEFTELCREIAPIAGRHGITLVIEPLHDCNFINYLWEGAKIVEAVDHANLKLLADFFHMLRSGDSPQELITFGEHLRHIHIAEPAERTPPGVEPYDFSPFFDALEEAGYDGRISLECKWGHNPVAEATSGIAYLKQPLAGARM